MTEMRTLVFVLAHVPGNLVFNHTASVFYWFMAGVALIPTVRPSSESGASPSTLTRVTARRAAA